VGAPEFKGEAWLKPGYDQQGNAITNGWFEVHNSQGDYKSGTKPTFAAARQEVIRYTGDPVNFPTRFLKNPGMFMYAYYDLAPDENRQPLEYGLQKMKYQWQMNAETNLVITWAEIFHPAWDSSDEPDRSGTPVVKVLSWTNTTGATNSPRYTIDPLNYTNANGSRQTNTGWYEVTLLPVEMKVVDRDDPKKKWGSEKDHNASKPVYAGESCGDMVSWKLGGTDSWSSTTFTWTAEGPGGETKTGPTGAGKNEWKIADGDDDTANDWLKWKPGKWKIKVQIGSTQAEFEQEVGWRTEDYVVIGQIVETHTHDGDAPPLVAVGNNFWEISSPVALYRRAVLYDMLDLPVFDGVPDAARDALMVTPLPITAKLSEAWFGYWYLMPAGLTPKGPFTQAHPSGNGNVQNGHRFWALQHIFNVSPDAPLVQPTFNADTFDTIKDAEQYRVIHRYKSKFVVTSDGKIDSGKVVKINHVAEGGPTKMNFGIAAGEFSPIWNNPAYTFFSLPKQPSETNQYQGAHAVSQDGKKLSYYATGRVGAGGQNVNWRLMGKDAPWIFSEIIVELKPDRTVAAQIKASVDKSWNETTGAVAGETAFNKLNLYKGLVEKRIDGSFVITFTRQQLMSMEGELEPFINSASGQRPEPPIPPSVQ